MALEMAGLVQAVLGGGALGPCGSPQVPADHKLYHKTPAQHVLGSQQKPWGSRPHAERNPFLKGFGKSALQRTRRVLYKQVP